MSRIALALVALPWAWPTSAGDTSRWILSPEDAIRLVRAGALVLDARDASLAVVDRPSGAVPVSWQDFAEPDFPYRGRLLADDAELTRRLQALGVRRDVPVIVLGDPVRGWGEEGRVTWMLRALGHPQAAAVDGGLPALQALGLPEIHAPQAPGDFVVDRRAELLVDRSGVQAALGRPEVILLDTREVDEFEGASRNGESRGGHLPGARHLWYRDLQDADGRLLPREDLEQKLAALGIAPDTEVVAYCSGGVRAAWVTTVLNDLGYKARNFAGSMWDWSAGDAARFPLVSGD